MGIASALDRHIQFQRAKFGRSTLTWADHGDVIPALRFDVKDEELAKAGIFRELSLIRFQVRSTAFTKGITADDRVLHEGQLWGIVGIKEPVTGQRRQLLEITVEGPLP